MSSLPSFFLPVFALKVGSSQSCVDGPIAPSFVRVRLYVGRAVHSFTKSGGNRDGKKEAAAKKEKGEMLLPLLSPTLCFLLGKEDEIP